MNIKQVEASKRSFQLEWSDCSNSELPFIWLRDNDPHELHPQTHERIFDLTSVSLDIQPLSFEFDETSLTVDWPGKAEASLYSALWLHQHRPGHRRHDTARINKRSWPDAGVLELPRFDGKACTKSPKELLSALVSLKATGIVLIDKLADDPLAGEQFGELIGFKRESNYGVMFDVRSKPDPNNLAYTSLELPLHTDLANQEFVPGNQFLHCYRNNATGGGSRFADAMAIVDDFKDAFPQHYELLCSAQVPWHFIDDESDIRQHRPVIGLDRDGEFKGLTFNAHLADVPDFTVEMMYDFYAAFRELMIAIRTSKHNLEYVLKNGEMVIFDNQRILHGRASFDPDSGDRHLRGYYIEHNEIDNRIRMLAKQNP